MSRATLNFIKDDYKRDKERARDISAIRKLFDLRPKTEYFLDDQSFSDLDMNTVYKKLDKTYTSAGESALYSMLRNITTDEETLNERSNLIEFFKENENKRSKIQMLFFNMGFDIKNCFMEMLETFLQYGL